MKIKAAVVDKKGAKFDIRDDVELAEMQPDDLQVHMVATGICHSDEPCGRVMLKSATQLSWVTKVPGSLKKSAPKLRTSSRATTLSCPSTAVVTVSTV